MQNTTCMFNVCIHVSAHCNHICNIFLISPSSVENTHEAKTPPNCIPAISTKRERDDESESTDMEKFENECSFSTDHELQENTSRPKKAKRLE